MKNIMQYMMTGFIGLSMFFRPGSFLSAADKPKDKEGDAIKLTLAEDGKTIKAATGKKIEISLKGNPSTGFECSPMSGSVNSTREPRHDPDPAPAEVEA